MKYEKTKKVLKICAKKNNKQFHGKGIVKHFVNFKNDVKEIAEWLQNRYLLDFIIQRKNKTK